MRISYKILVGKYATKNLHLRLRLTSEGYIKMVLREIGCEGLTRSKWLRIGINPELWRKK
jgi:hypothetical protein